MVSAGSYLLSAIALATVAISLGLAAFRLRRRLLSGWEGAPARLVEAILAVALLIWICELLGLVGLLYGWSLAAASVLLAGFVLTSPGRGSAGPPQSPALPGMTAVALATVAVVFAHWGVLAKPALDHGISNFDSLWYHMPFAADIAQSHSVTGLHYTDTSYVGWFYTQNSELLNAAGILLTGRDTLSLFVNFGWLAVAFLAAWCVGRPYGRAPLTVIAAAVLLECNTLIVRAPGAAKNDTMTIACALAAMAILLNAWAAARRSEGGGQGASGGARAAGDPTPPRRSLEPGWALAAAGLAAGLAVGTRITVLPLAVALTGAALALAPAGRRWAAAGWWLGSAFAATGLWFVRNLIVAGNPLPQLTHLGPISLPHPERLQLVSNESTVLHYATDTRVWSEYFGPGLHEAFGSLWPLVVIGAIAGGLLALVQGRDRGLRCAGAVALVGLLGYLATPLGAGGAAGAPFNFWINVRYALPAMLVGLVLLPLAPGLDRTPAQWALLAGLLVVLFVTDGPHAVLHEPGGLFGLALALAVVVVPALLLTAKRLGEPRRVVFGGFALLALVVIALGYPLQRHYLRDRFAAGSGLPGYGLEPAYAWARDLHGARIGLAGSTAAFDQYGFYGTDLSNRVLYLGDKGPHGAFNAIPTCSAFRAAVDAADLDYLVTTPFLNFLDGSEPIASPEARWLRGSPGVEPIESNGPIAVWRLRGSVDPAACAAENAPLRAIPRQPGL